MTISGLLASTLLAAALPAGAQEPPPEPKKPEVPLQDAEPVPSRWRIPFPEYPLNEPGNLFDPYHQNVLKGDYPVLGEATFVNLTGRLDSTFETRRLPTPSGVSTAHAGSPDFFGGGGQNFINMDLAGTLELYEGNTSFRPRDWEIRATGVMNYTSIELRENRLVGPDVRSGTKRVDHFAALEEGLVEAHLLDLSDRYDFVSLRVGIQPFVSDFRGFLFSDTNLGARLFGTLGSNRIQWNLAAFDMLEKDTNSTLNTFDLRHELVWVGNLYVQDFLWPGYTAEASIHVLRDDPTVLYDKNHFLVRPADLGTVQPHRVDATYFGWAGDGHIGDLNLTHAAYAVEGTDHYNELAGQKTYILAFLAAAELSYDMDWMRLRASFLWASGDRDTTDNRASGFDSILEAPNFAGGAFSFWNRQAIGLGGVNLTNRSSELPDLRSSKLQGQANFVNPGLFLYNAGVDVDVLPEMKAILNANLLRFQDTQSLQVLTQQAGIRKDVGIDLSLGLIIRPLLNNNVT
ncbi:MAG TPA: hypothetical protein VEN81_03020, partial [Planctomycetota bacterium]|nr:hypothetical protein [Planctomycetota bacterium]